MTVYSVVNTDLWQDMKFLQVLYRYTLRPLTSEKKAHEILRIYRPCNRPCDSTLDTPLSVHQCFSPVITAMDTVRNYTTVYIHVLTDLIHACEYSSEILPTLQAL